MPTKSQRLELTWIGKDEQPKLEPRILIEDPSKSFGDPKSQNMLIHGDNLLALKALEQDFAGRIKCIYIDPPYNTGSAFEHYDDGLEHSTWLNLMSQRLAVLKNLLSNEGSLWITLDDSEVHYCKVVCDDIFGRSNFVGEVIWEKSDSPRMDATFFSVRHDHILVYSKNLPYLIFNREIDDKIPEHYNKKDEHGRLYYLKPLRVMGGNISESLFFGMIAPDGTEVLPYEPDGAKGCWRWSKKKVEAEIERIEWVHGRNGWTPYFRIYADNRRGRPPETIWTHEEVGSNRTSKNEIRSLFSDDIFDTPKPERLLRKILAITTVESDLVLDSFLGSGTTTAVAHKMGRRWIGIELGDHAVTHCLPRLQKVVKGEDAGGITESVGWKGGGGFKFYTLASSLLRKDSFGNWVIDEAYNPDMLAAAMAKHENYRYHPSDTIFWKQGQSTEKDFIYTTTQFVTRELIDKIHEQMQEGESLLICCKSFQSSCADGYPNINVKKIPNMLLGRCEFGREDYSLNIINLPKDEESDEEPVMEDKNPEKNGDVKNEHKRTRKKREENKPSLFGDEE